MSLSNFTTSRREVDVLSALNPSTVVSARRSPVFEPAVSRFTFSDGPEPLKKVMRDAPLHSFSIYTEMGAYKRIKWTVNTITKLAGQRRQCSSEMWKLDTFAASEPMRRMLTSDAANAEVLIVVMRALERRTPEMIETIQWLDSLAPLRADRPGLLIGLLGDEDNKTEELDWTTEELNRCSQKTNRKFIWNWMGRYAMEDDDWLKKSVERLLAHKQIIIESPVLEEAMASAA